MIQRIPTATDAQIVSILAGVWPKRIGTAPKCEDCGRFASREDLRIGSYCNTCRVKHLTTGTPYWKFQEVEA